jgi:hypothetical protein
MYHTPPIFILAALSTAVLALPAADPAIGEPVCELWGPYWDHVRMGTCREYALKRDYFRLQSGSKCGGRAWTVEASRGRSLAGCVERCDECVGRAIAERKENVRCTLAYRGGGNCTYGYGT